MIKRFSFVTNATSADGVRLEKVLPHVQNVFQDKLEEVLVIVDRQAEEGRIKKLHQKSNNSYISIDAVIKKFESKLVRFEELDYSQINQISLKWFGRKGVNRCQNGTPIFAFLYGIEHATSPYILRTDCDILFFDGGFVDKMFAFSETFDLVQLPFLNDSQISFSTRCFFTNKNRIQDSLPLRPHKVDILRQIHRLINRRSTFLALEDTFDIEIKRNKINRYTINCSDGYTMHIPTRAEFSTLEPIIERFAKNDIPEIQLLIKHDYIPAYWNGEVETHKENIEKPFELDK